MVIVFLRLWTMMSSFVPEPIVRDRVDIQNCSVEPISNYVSVWVMSDIGKHLVKGLCHQRLWWSHSFSRQMYLAMRTHGIHTTVFGGFWYLCMWPAWGLLSWLNWIDPIPVALKLKPHEHPVTSHLVLQTGIEVSSLENVMAWPRLCADLWHWSRGKDFTSFFY